MHDMLFLFYLIVTALSIAGIALGLIVCVKSHDALFRVVFTVLVFLTVIEINGVGAFYFLRIHKGFYSITFDWNFTAYFLFQTLMNGYLLSLCGRYSLSRGRKAWNWMTGFYLAVSAVLLAMYLLINRVLPLFASKVDWIYQWVYFSGINLELAVLLPAVVHSGQILVNLMVAVVLLKKAAGVPGGVYRTSALLVSVLLLVFTPVWVYSHFCTNYWLFSIDPVTFGSVFLLLFNGIYFRILWNGLNGIFREKEMIVTASEAFLEKYRFSKREREIIQLVLQGRAYKEMAADLNLSLSTIKTHLQNIYEKTKARSRMELMQAVSRFQDRTPRG